MYYLVWKNMMPFTIGLHSLYVKKVVSNMLFPTITQKSKLIILILYFA